jgi:creatinine amidohydrolase
MAEEALRNNLLECSYVEVQEWLKRTDLVLVPFGSCERHGPHIPIGTDSFHTWEVTTRASKKSGVPHAPMIPYGYSPHHMHKPGFGAGTITLRARTVQAIVYDVAKSLIYHGFNKIIFVAAHGSYSQVIEPAIRNLKYSTNALVVWYKPFYEREIGALKGILENPPEETPGWHSSEMETSEIMAVRPDLVKMERAVKELAHAPKWLGPKFTKTDGVRTVAFEGVENAILPMEHYEYTDSAVIGNPFRASPEKGEKIFEAQATHLAHFVNELKNLEVKVKDRDFPDRAW